MYREIYKNWVLQILQKPNEMKLLLSAENKELGIRYYDERNIYKEKITEYHTHSSLFGCKTKEEHSTRYLEEETLQDAIKDLKGIVEVAYLIEQKLRKNIKQVEIKWGCGVLDNDK